MKQVAMIVLLAAVLAVCGLFPFESSDVADLTPVEALTVSLERGQVVLDGGEARGRGDNWYEALADLRRSAGGTVFLETAEQIVLTGRAAKLLPQIVQSGVLRPAAVVCAAETPPDPKEAAAYLSAHDAGLTVRDVQAALLTGQNVTLPVLAETEGGLRLYGAKNR